MIPPAGNRLTHMQLDFVASVVDAAARADLDVLLSPSGGDHDRSFERLVSESRVDGVILMEIRLEDARVGRLQRAGLPFVGIGHTAGDQAMCWIDIDYAGLIAPYRPAPGRPRPPQGGTDQPLPGTRRGGLRSRAQGAGGIHSRPSTSAV